MIDLAISSYTTFQIFFNAILPCVPIQKHQYVNKGKVAAASEEQSMDSRRHCIYSTTAAVAQNSKINTSYVYY